MKEMKTFTKDIVNEIKKANKNISTTILPAPNVRLAGKFMIKVKTKNGQMLVCQDPSCKTKEERNVKQMRVARTAIKDDFIRKENKQLIVAFAVILKHKNKWINAIKNKGKNKVSKREMKNIWVKKN